MKSRDKKFPQVSISILLLLFVIFLSIFIVLWVLLPREAEIPAQEFVRTRSQLMFFILTIASLLVFVVVVVIGFLRSTMRLSEKEYEISAIISHLTDGLVEYDKGNRILLINPIAEEILGVNHSQVVGQIIQEKTLIPFDTFGNLSKIFFQVRGTTEYQLFSHIPLGKGREVRLATLDIEKPVPRNLVVIEIAFSVSGKEGVTERFAKIIRDVTRERLLAQMKSDFISIAAHQLRTPLSAVKWTFRMLLDGDLGSLTPKQAEFVGRGYETNERMIRLIGDLLDLSRIEEGRFGYRFEMLDFIPFIEEAIQQFEPRFQEKKFIVDMWKPPKEERIFFDSDKMTVAIRNILENALQYTPEGGSITISIEEKPPYLEVAVKDTGVGIPERQLHRIFTKFFRGENVMRLQTEGTGLGLFIVKNIIMMHGGRIWIESRENVGTTVFFLLPLEPVLVPKEEKPVTEFIERL